MAGTFASRHEHHIALACIGIVVFDEEELVHAVILERRDLDYVANGASKTSFDDEVLFTADLWRERKKGPLIARSSDIRFESYQGGGRAVKRERGSLTYSF